MSFSDDVRKNYKPSPKQPIDPDRYKKVAEHQVNLAKRKLMSLSKSGKVTNLYTGLGIVPKKVFQTSIGITIEKSIDSVVSLTYDGEDCGIGVHDRMELNKLFTEMRCICSADDIRLKLCKSDMSGKFFIRLWIEI